MIRATRGRPAAQPVDETLVLVEHLHQCRNAGVGDGLHVFLQKAEHGFHIAIRRRPNSVKLTSPSSAGLKRWMISCRRPLYSSTSAATSTTTPASKVPAMAGAFSQTRARDLATFVAQNKGKVLPSLTIAKGLEFLFVERVEAHDPLTGA